MDNEESDKLDAGNTGFDDGAVNSSILDYYKKFGRKRDLEQYFSLSTAQSDLKDPSSSFWQKMKSENDSSGSGGKKSESSTEICRISIKCTLPDPSSSQDENTKTKSDTDSPPIVTEETKETFKHSDNESVKSDDYHSHKSVDATLDTSLNKPFSPTSSINSQRRLEWDSLADVGYANESDRKTSGSSLSTLERLALKQQYSNNDSNKEDMGAPDAHSTLLDSKDSKSKSKRGLLKKTTSIYKKDVDVVELNMPKDSDSRPQAINVNLTKHISFNVEKDGGVTIDKQDVKLTADKVISDAVNTPKTNNDKEIQTSFRKLVDRSSSMDLSKNPESKVSMKQGIPLLITFNTLKRRRQKKRKKVHRGARSKKGFNDQRQKENVKEKSADQVSEAESFEYMPGHIYNQNQMKDRNANVAGNKSSLESSGAPTTDSSKGSKHSFTKDLEKSINLLKNALHKRNNDSELKHKLIKEVVQRLLESKYRDDDTSTEFLSGLSIKNKNSGDRHYTTTSTSDGNNTNERIKPSRPKKSILISDKFNANALASTSQSAPNLPSVSKSDKPVSSNLSKHKQRFYTESDNSSKEKNSSDPAIVKTSSEELYQKYVEALKREETYKRHLKDKEIFLKQKLVCSDSAVTVPVPEKASTNKRLQELIKDLTRNNYDDGSGDASKLEGGSTSNITSTNNIGIKKQRSHSVFTLSSGNSDCQKGLLRNRLLKEIKGGQGCVNDQECICPYHSNNAKVHVADSSCQVNIECSCKKGVGSQQKSLREVACFLPESIGENLKYVCLCSDKVPEAAPENFLMYKCSRLINTAVQYEGGEMRTEENYQCSSSKTSPKKFNKADPQPSTSKHIMACSDSIPLSTKNSKCSQTNITLDRNIGKPCKTPASLKENQSCESSPRRTEDGISVKKLIHESTRWAQTEINMNPKISDVLLSDVHFINDCDCSKLVEQKFREVTKSSSDTCCKTCNDGSDGLENFCEDARIKSNTLVNEKPLNNIDITASCKVHNGNTDNYKIPIQGTNMTLMVSIGANKVTTVKETSLNNSISDKSIETENINIADKATSLAEDCSKSVQCQGTVIQNENVNITKQKSSVSKKEVKKEDPSPSHSIKNSPVLTKKMPAVKNFGTDPKSSTYPKCFQIKENKPFRRSNTDSGIISYHVNKEAEKFAPVTKSTDCSTETSRSSTQKSKKCGCSLGSRIETEVQKNSPPRPSSPTKNLPRVSSPIFQQTHLNLDNKSARRQRSPEPGRSDNWRSTSVGAKCSASTQWSPADIGSPTKNCSGSSGQSLTKHSCDSGSMSPPQSFRTRNTKNLNPSKDQDASKDLIVDMIQNITDRYTKKDAAKPEKRKCFKEIVKVLNYLLDTEESTDSEIKEREHGDFKPKDTKKVIYKYNNPSRNNAKGDEMKRDCKLKEIKKVTNRSGSPNKEGACVDEVYVGDCRPKSNQCKNLTCSCCQCKKTNRSASSSPVRKTVGKPSCGRSKSPKRIIHVNSCRTEFVKDKKSKDRGVQCSFKKFRQFSSNTESSDVFSREHTSTSPDSDTCRVVNKIRKECDKYQQKRSSTHDTRGKSCTCSHCTCRGHKCKSNRTKTPEKPKKKCLAYNLYIQTSDSLLRDDPSQRKCNPLKNIIMKVPRNCDPTGRVPFQELSARIIKDAPCSEPEQSSFCSRTAPNESEPSTTTNESKRNPTSYTVRDYLEKNRPDFVESCNDRQNCLKLVSKSRANERAAKREMLSVQVQQSPLRVISENDLRQFARLVGIDLRRRKEPAKFISEREMKKHSEKIYKSLPEVVRKKEEARKENIKRTNLLMASLFKKNLQKKTLRGTVNVSNYSPIIKI